MEPPREARHRMRERIVVVGHAAVTCLGRDMDATWDGLIAGRSGLRRHEAFAPERFLQDIAGMVEDFGPGTPGEDPAVVKAGRPLDPPGDGRRPRRLGRRRAGAAAA